MGSEKSSGNERPLFAQTHRVGLSDFWTVYTERFDEAEAATGSALDELPLSDAVRAALRSGPTQGYAIPTRAQLARAIETSDWGPYEAGLRAWGAHLERDGVAVHALPELSRRPQRAITPHVVRAFVEDPPRLTAALTAMIAFYDHALTTLGAPYLDQAQQALRFRDIVAAVRDYAVFVLDVDGNVETWNAGAEAIKGYRFDEIRGKHIATFFTPEDRAVGRPERLLARARTEGRVEDEAWRVRKDGTRFWASVVVSAMRDATGALRGFAKITRDLTERRRAEDALRASENASRELAIQLHAANEQLEQRVAERTVDLQHTIDALARESRERHQAELALRESEERFRQSQKMEAVGRLAGGVAHDFNNVLSVILSYSAALSADLSAGDPMREDLDEIRAAAERAAELTQQLLAFSRRQVLQPVVLDLTSIVLRSEKMLRRLISEDIELVVRSVESDDRVRIDPAQLEQVLLNLVVNARDAMPHGGRLTIETHRVVLDDAFVASHPDVVAGPYLELTVRDTGVGMDDATRARIFEPFYTTKAQGKGTGLGLSTVHGVVHQSGGSVVVESAPGVGSTFRIFLPLVAPDVAHRSPPSTGRGATAPDSRGQVVLLVEDEDLVRRAARAILRRGGYTVLEASNGGEALLLSEQHAGVIHAMVTDVVMPGMSGVALAARLAPLRPAMRVLFMSGYTDHAVLEAGLRDSGGAFLQKPFTPELLLSGLASVLAGAATDTTSS